MAIASRAPNRSLRDGRHRRGTIPPDIETFRRTDGGGAVIDMVGSGMVSLSTAELEALGRKLLAEIGLDQPHEIADGYYGSVRIPYRNREIVAPWPTPTSEELYVLTHELGHWHLHTEQLSGGRWEWRDGLKRYVMEYESELYAQRKLEELGVPPPEEWVAYGKVYVAHWIRRELRLGTELPDETIRQWAGVDVDKERKAEWGLAAHRMLRRVRRDRSRPMDILVGFVHRFAKPNTKVEILAKSTRGRDWLDRTPYVIPVGNSIVPWLYQAPIEEMVGVANAVAQQAVLVQRC